VQVSREDNLPELRVKIDRDKAGALGINVAAISNTITTASTLGCIALYRSVTGNIYNILVRLSEDYRSNIDDLKNIVIPTANGDQVLLGKLRLLKKQRHRSNRQKISAAVD